MLGQEGALLGGRGLSAAGAGDHRDLAGLQAAGNLVPQSLAGPR